MWNTPSSRTLIAMLLALVQSIGAFAQRSPGPPPTAQLSAAAQQIRSRIESLPVGGKLTVDMLDGSQYYGNLHTIESDSFSIREVDLKRVLTLRYAEVKKVRKDYGRRGFGGKRVHPRTNLIAALAVVGGLVLLIALVASDKS
jgi:hypothetical protein